MSALPPKADIRPRDQDVLLRAIRRHSTGGEQTALRFTNPAGNKVLLTTTPVVLQRVDSVSRCWQLSFQKLIRQEQSHSIHYAVGVMLVLGGVSSSHA
jgi:hypothetical protein